MTDSTTPTHPSWCPDWCDQDKCAEKGDLGIAFHQAVVLKAGAAAGDICLVTGDRTPSGALSLRTDTLTDLSAQDCRDAAAALVATAERLEQIQGAEA